jgi:transposase InsO family protein
VRAFIDQYRHAYGVEPICRVMQVAPSGYWRYAAQQRTLELRCARSQRDDVLSVDIERVWQANLQVYGADKVWRQLRRKGTEVARCTEECLMRKAVLRGFMRGRVVRTTVADAKAPCPLDRVNRQFKAQRPNRLWVSDFTYVSTWRGFVYAAFVIDVFARRVVGWRVSRSMRTDFLLDAGAVRPAARAKRAGPSCNRGLAIRIDKVQRTPGRNRHRAVCGQQGRQL